MKKIIILFIAIITGIIILLSFCDDDTFAPAVEEPTPPTPNIALRYGNPCLFLWEEDITEIRERLTSEPYLTWYDTIKTRSGYDHNDGEAGVYNGELEDDNGNTAKDNAFVALMDNDKSYADKAIDFLLQLRTDVENNPTWDDDINIAQALHGYVSAYDLLKATDFMDESTDAAIYDLLTELTANFYKYYTYTFPLFLKLTQNNHNLKTASAIGIAGIVLHDHEDAWKWLGFGMTEIQALIDAGLYIDEGGCAEGPNYFDYCMIDVLPFLIAYHRNYGMPHYFTPVCAIRWDETTCVEEEVLIEDLLFHPAIQNTFKWQVLIRMPNGYRPTFDDASASIALSGLAAPFYEDPMLNWDFAENPSSPYKTVYSNDLSANNICLYDPDIGSSPPDEDPSIIFEEAGQVIFRNSWDEDSLYFLMLGENGDMRCMGHEHSDPTSFMLYGFGQYLLQDNGYPGYTKRSKTCEPEHHNMILVDGEGPSSDIAYAMNGSDGFIQNSVLSDSFDYSEVVTEYKGVSFIRSALFASKEYIIIHDRVSSSSTHTYSWMLHGYSGGDLGGTFNLYTDGAEWITASNGKVRAWISSTQGNLTFSSGEGYNACYRTLHTHNYIQGDISGKSPQFLSVLYPANSSGSYPTVNIDYPESGVAVMQIELSTNTEIAVANNTGGEITVSVSGFDNITTSDNFVWISFDSSDNVNHYFIQNNGSAMYGSQSLEQYN